MRLSDVMSSMQLSSYAEVALLLFLGAFIAVAVSLFWGRKGEEWERCRQLPLDGTEPSPAPGSGTPTTVIAPGNHQP